MTQPSRTDNVGPATSADEPLTKANCKAILARVCFGHLSFMTGGHVDVRPVRYAYRNDWVYFRASRELRGIIAQGPWFALSVTEFSEPTRVATIVVRGACYEADSVRSVAQNAEALAGIVELRDRAEIGSPRAPRIQRSSTVFRMHVDEMHGVRAHVPCPPGQRPYSPSELQNLRDSTRSHSAGEDSRADDDGMAEPNPPQPVAAGLPSPMRRR